MRNVKMAAVKLSNQARQELLENLRYRLSGGEEGTVIFRTVQSVVPKDLLRIQKFTSPDKFGENLGTLALDAMSSADRERYVQIDYRSFYGFTNARSMRKEHESLNGRQIYFRSDTFSQIDVTSNVTFDFSDSKHLCRPTTPCVGDLLCIFISNDNECYYSGSRENIRADKWFIASNQFLHAWTAIMYDRHETFDKLVGSKTAPADFEKILRKKLFSGNHLTTNGWRKFNQALAAEGKVMTEEQSIERYWHLRSEYASRKWVDIWAAVVLLARYGEIPGPMNVPNTLDNGPKRTAWDLPNAFISNVTWEGLPIHKLTKETLINYNDWKDRVKTDYLFSEVKNGKVIRSGFLDEFGCINKPILPSNKIPAQETSPETSEAIVPIISNEKEFPELPKSTWATIVSKPVVNQEPPIPKPRPDLIPVSIVQPIPRPRPAKTKPIPQPRPPKTTEAFEVPKELKNCDWADFLNEELCEDE